MIFLIYEQLYSPFLFYRYKITKENNNLCLLLNKISWGTKGIWLSFPYIM